jgi:hypothetical protein
MYQGVIDKLEREKVTKKIVPQVQVTPQTEVKTVVVESTPVEKVSFKDKVKRLQAASNKVKKPVQVETKKRRNVVELW